jgi:hypothetical protein
MKRWLIGFAVLSVLLAIAVSAHLYVRQRMVLDAQLAAPWSGLATAVIAVGFAAMLLQLGEQAVEERARAQHTGSLIGRQAVPAPTTEVLIRRVHEQVVEPVQVERRGQPFEAARRVATTVQHDEQLATRSRGRHPVA